MAISNLTESFAFKNDVFDLDFDLKSLVVTREKTLLIVLSLISALTWAGLIFATLNANSGTIVFLVLATVSVIFFAIFFTTGMLAARLKAEAVEITSDQLPELYKSLTEGCQRLQMRVPRLFVMQSGGALNAFAMRHARRDFIVLYSELVEGFSPSSSEVRFIIGHELGHIQRQHILKSFILLPSMLLPLFGLSYLRACESTCDRYGAFIAQDAQGSIRAMLALAGGTQLCQSLDPAIFARQYVLNRGFFVSFYELISSYPTASKRVSDLIALHRGTRPLVAQRSIFSYWLSCFVPSTGLLATIAVIYIGVTVGYFASKAASSAEKAALRGEADVEELLEAVEE